MINFRLSFAEIAEAPEAAATYKSKVFGCKSTNASQVSASASVVSSKSSPIETVNPSSQLAVESKN